MPGRSDIQERVDSGFNSNGSGPRSDPFYFLVLLPQPAASYIGYGYGAGRNISFHPVPEIENSIIINGQMTFNQIEKITGLDSAEIIKALGLPAETPADKTLGQLKNISFTYSTR